MVAALPLSLLALLFACPLVLGANESEEQRSSPNDPFRALALQKPKPKADEHPVCCLRPLSAPEPVDDGMLLSFEEWKMKQLASEAVPVSLPKLNTSNGTDLPTERTRGDTYAPIPPTEDTPTPADWDPQHQHDALDLLLSQPQFRVPLTDRFNYASLDCSARVHTAHRSAKSPSSILSSKKDRYMLSPCDKTREKQFVVVELCEDIRIDTVQLANFEFFSGVFKDFTVSVSKTYTTSPEDWTVVATYRAKNVRGVQSFRWPTSSSSRDFYRFIRIDFLSHYGTEYYCPVSLLRVYGLTHLEEWKWEVWEAESRQRLVEAQRRGVLALPATEQGPVVAPVASVPTVVVESTVVATEPSTVQSGEPPSTQNTAVLSPHANRSNLKAYIPEYHISQGPSAPTNEPISPISPSSASHTTQSHSQTQNQNQNQAKEHAQAKNHSTDTYASSSHSSPPSSPSPSISVSGSVQSIPTQNIPSSMSSSSASTSSVSSVSQTSSAASGSATAPNGNTSSTPAPSISTESSVQAASSAPSTSASISISSAAISSSDATGSTTPTPPIIVSLPSPSPPAQQPPPPPASLSPSAPLPPSASTPIPIPQPPPIQHKPHLPPSSTGGGESIYRTILNKLADVELNQTLHMRYVELQHARVREGLRRLGEDVGRLEGGMRAQSAKYQRTLDEWDRQRYQLEMEYGELISRIEYLSEEITLEKRLGVAQLLLLLAVLIFMGLTRGSRAETPSPTPAMTSNRQRLREWGRRHFRLSGDWDWRFGRKKESGSGTESDTRTERVPGPPRTPSPLPGDGAAKRMKSGKHVPPRLPLDSRSSYDDEDLNPILYPSTSQPYISTRKAPGSRNQNRNQPLTPISLNALPTAPVSLSLSQCYSYSSSRSENRHAVRQRTSSNPRSRAPSLRSTPRRTHVHAQHPFARPVTPTSATFLHHHQHQQAHPHQPLPFPGAVQLRPQMLQRSSSHGMGVGVGVGGVGMLPSASWGSVLGAGAAAGGGGNVPKSARKWARTAHLHEVKSAVGGGGRGKGKGKEKEQQGDEERGAEKDDVFSSSSGVKPTPEEQRSPQPLEGLLLKPEEAENGAEHEDDGDTWVDTDSVGGSELDVEAEVEVEVNQGHSVGLGPAAPAGSGGPSTSRSKDLVGSDSFVKPPLIPFPSA